MATMSGLRRREKVVVGNGGWGLAERERRLRDWMARMDSELSTRPRWRDMRLPRGPHVTRIRRGVRWRRWRETGADREAMGNEEVSCRVATAETDSIPIVSGMDHYGPSTGPSIGFLRQTKKSILF